jgi:hypothetical protein
MLQWSGLVELSVTIRGHKKAKRFRESVKNEAAHKGYWRESKRSQDMRGTWLSLNSFQEEHHQDLQGKSSD